VLLCADEKSVITYLVAFYHYFSKLRADEVDMKRLSKLVSFLLDIEAQQREYVRMTHELLEWIRRHITLLQARTFPNNLPGLQKLLSEFKQYRTVTKPPRFVDRGNLEAHLFAIQTQLFGHKQPMFHPPEGLLISDINAVWVVLEQCEHSREIDLRAAVLRQERLQQLAARFDHKAALREVWLADNLKIIERDDFGSDLAGALAAQKRHEAIETDAAAHEGRIKAVGALEEQLIQEGYHAADDIADRAEAIMTQWSALRDRLRARRLRLEETLRVQAVIQSMKESSQTMSDLSASIAATGPGSHLGECEDTLQRHTLREHDIAQLFDRVCELSAQAQVFVDQVCCVLCVCVCVRVCGDNCELVSLWCVCVCVCVCVSSPPPPLPAVLFVSRLFFSSFR
jgi:spectrin beta